MSSDGLEALIQAIADHFRSHGTWPTFHVLDRRIDGLHGLDAASLIGDSPPSLVVADRMMPGHRSDATCGLTMLGLCAAGLAEEAQLLVRAVEWLAEQERTDEGDGPTGVMRASDALAEALGLTDTGRVVRVAQLYSMMSLTAPEIWQALSGDHTGWTVTVKRDIRKYRGVGTVRSYLDAMAGQGRSTTEGGAAGAPSLAGLLGEIGALRLMATSLQVSETPSAEMTGIADVLRERYRRWYATALSQLPADLVDRFRGEYEGSLFSPKIRKFLEEPLATTEEAKALLSKPDGPTLPLGHWSYEAEKTFGAPISAQALVLMEAEARPSPAAAAESAPDLLDRALERVGRLARELTKRRQNRPGLEINDEYDLQDLVRGLLRVLFDDVRPEDPLPSHAGASSRVDFVIPEIKSLIELKFVKHRGRDKEIGAELFVDAGRYEAAAPNYDRFIALIYDPQGLLDNPSGLVRDLTRRHGSLDVIAIVAH